MSENNQINIGNDINDAADDYDMDIIIMLMIGSTSNRHFVMGIVIYLDTQISSIHL